MIVTKLKIQGLLGIKVFIADNLSSVVKLKGRNGAGKSRIMTLLLAALKYDSLPLAKRKEILASQNGLVEVDLGDQEELSRWTITRRIKNGTTMLHVKSKENKLAGQEALNQFIGDNFVDLGRFLELPKEKKEAVVLQMLGLQEPLDQNDRHYKEIYETRREIGRDRDGIGFTETAPEAVEAVSVSDLIDERQQIEEFNREQIKRATEIAGHEQYREGLLERKSELEEELESVCQQLKENEHVTSVLPKSEPLKGTEEIDAKIAGSEEANEKARRYQDWLRKKQVFEKFQKKYDACTAELDAIKNERADLIASKKFPVEGLSYGEGGLLFRGHALISDGEYRKIAFKIARELRGALSIATFENFALLDPGAQKEVIADSREAGFQIFCEIVTGPEGNDGDGFYIEEGER